MRDDIRNEGDMSNELLPWDVPPGDSSSSTPAKMRLDDGAHYTTPKKPCDPTKIEKICEMGFSQADAEHALNIANGELHGALEQLISSEQQRQKTSPLLSQHHSPSKSMSVVPSSAADRESFGPVPVLSPTRTSGMLNFPIVLGEKKDIISDLDPDKVLLVIHSWLLLLCYCHHLNNLC